jgi:hypothetical protein
MERNDNLGNLGDASGAAQGGTTGGTGGTAGGVGGFGGTSDVGGTSAGYGTSGGVGGMSGGSSTGGYGGTSGGDASGVADRAKNVAGNAQERLSDVGSTVRDRAGQAKNSLADALEAGAERLRGRGGQLAGPTGYGDSSVTTDSGRVAELGDRVAGGLQSSADWLREADLDGLRQGVEKQVKENPGRTLLIAVGLGYLLGKAFRR